jgi:molybdopterin molybdotransferase/putative molybdopterin biosynthesis protein
MILNESKFETRMETLPVRQALGRVTASEVRAVNNLPNSPSSSMDGIAIKSANLTGEIPDTSGWREGVEFVFSNTGVGIPDEYDTVVLIEDVEVNDDHSIRITSIPKPGQNVKKVGDNLKAGEVLVTAHQLLGPAQLCLLAAGGITAVQVICKPRVAILPTGNELVSAGTTPPRGKNVESNGTLITATVEQAGGEAILYPITSDEPAEIRKTIQDALGRADIVILNGGTSKGTDDRSIEVLESLGRVLVYEMDYGPGKHTTMTIVDSKPIVGTVGPTFGCEFAIDFYVKPLMNSYLGIPDLEPARIKVRLAEDFIHSGKVNFHARLLLTRTTDGFEARRAPFALIPQLMSDAYLFIPGGSGGYKTGDEVEVVLSKPVEWIGR